MSSTPSPPIHLSKQLAQSSGRVTAQTRYGPVVGGRSSNGCAAFLEIPYAQSTGRFEDPVSLEDVEGFRYPEGKEYLYETAYAAQPSNDGQAAGIAPQDKLGLGKPSENPLFLNIVVPPSFDPNPNSSNPQITRKYPVKIYIHGGFLQFGSPHGLSALSTGVSALRDELWVNIGYRLSTFGFLAGEIAYEGEETVRLNGNYGFKDAWCAVNWVRENIAAFGGDERDVTLTGLSAGGHVVHQLLHRAASDALYHGRRAPFDRAAMQSNAILATPKPPTSLTPQLIALLHKLGLLEIPSSSSTLSRASLLTALSALRDPSRVSIPALTNAIEELDEEALGTFRGCLSGGWIPGSATGRGVGDGGDVEEGEEAPVWDHVERQRSGDLSRGLRKAGVRSVLVGEMAEEWYLYAIAHPCPLDDESLNDEILAWAEHTATRYVPPPLAHQFVHAFKNTIDPGDNKTMLDEAREKAGLGKAQVLAGVALSAVQVYVPVRRFEREVGRGLGMGVRVGGGEEAEEGEEEEGVPVVRYVIEWAPEAAKKWAKGYITHATDRPLWTLSTALTSRERDIAENWLDVVHQAVRGAESHGGKGIAKREGKVLVLDKQGVFDWKEDWRTGVLEGLGVL